DRRNDGLADRTDRSAAREDDRHPDRPIPTEPTVALLRWPDDAEERERLAAAGEPRVLVLSDFAAPPSRLDDLELWVLDGAPTSDLLAAMDTLRDRARKRIRPFLDADGLLWFDGVWVAVPDTQLPVV